MTESTPTPTSNPDPTSTASADAARARLAARSKPAKAGKGSRFLAAGAAVGLSLAAVGGMSAAAESADPAPQPTPVVQRVVVPQPAQPQQIVIVLPQTGSTEMEPVVIAETTPVVAPAKSATPDQAITQQPAAKKPVAESGGS